MNGLLIIDKPQGMTSHDVVRRVRRVLRTRRVGHAGTLDPMATGILQVAVGESTRLVPFLMAGEKTYRAVLKLGEATDTQDAEGRVVATLPVPDLGRGEIEAACRQLTGSIRQLPPMFSALKHQGVPLHRLARQGREVEREEREVQIHRLEVLAVALPLVTIEVDCGKGTYIRTLAHDLGLLLGTGAHLVALRRTRSGPFGEADCLPLDRLTEETAAAALLPPPEALRGHPALEVREEAAARLRNGIPPDAEEVEGRLPAEGETVLLLEGRSLRAVARFDPHRSREKRGDFELQRVFPPSSG